MNEAWYDLPEWDENEGWALTLPPPSVGDAWVQPHIIRGHLLWWSCHWITEGIGGSGYYYQDLSKALESVGRYINDMRKIFGP